MLKDRPTRILFNLIQRTKEAVRRMDSLSYKRLKKIVIEEAVPTNIPSQSVAVQQKNGPAMVIFTDDFYHALNCFDFIVEII